MKKKLKILIIFLFVLCWKDVCAQCHYENISFKVGEKLNYTGYYQLGIIWIAAGKVDLEVNDGVYKGKQVYKIFGTGRSAKSFDWFFRLRDTLESYMDKQTLAPYLYSKITNEKNHFSHRIIEYDYLNNSIYSKRFRRKGQTIDTLNFEGCLSDLVSIAYHSRNINFEEYGQGARIPITLVVDGKMRKIHIRYMGYDIVKTRHKKNYECYKISPHMPEGAMFKGGDDMRVWLSRDANRVPVMIETKVVVGKVKAILESFENLRSESNSIFGTRSGTFEKPKKNIE